VAEVAQFAQEHEDTIQVVGLGTQDDFSFAREFRESGGLEDVTLLWDPSFATWQALGIQANSQMMVVSPDLGEASSLIFGFTEDQQAGILEFVAGI